MSSPATSLAVTPTAGAARRLLDEAAQTARAVRLIRLGARMAVLESETTLAHDRLVRLYREVTGKSPSKGQLPYSTDWFVEWQPNIHASLFLNIHCHLDKAAVLEPVELLMKSWELYREQTHLMGVEQLLPITRAWRLVKFVDTGMLSLTHCTHCGARMVTHAHEYGPGFAPFVCGLCVPPARAGKSRREGAIH